MLGSQRKTPLRLIVTEVLLATLVHLGLVVCSMIIWGVMLGAPNIITCAPNKSEVEKLLLT